MITQNENMTLVNFRIETTPIHSVLLSIGVPPNLLGYTYIVYATELLFLRPKYRQVLTKELYADIAIKYHTTISRVERDIRHAIHTTWLYGNVDVIDKIFKNCIRSDKGAPTNSMFLARLYFYISNMEAQ